MDLNDSSAWMVIGVSVWVARLRLASKSYPCDDWSTKQFYHVERIEAMQIELTR
jgi:hypothetical protein